MIQRYKNPATEFEYTNNETISGLLSTEGDNYILQTTNFLRSGNTLEITFPTIPAKKEIASASVQVFKIPQKATSEEKNVQIEIVSGKYDHSCLYDSKMRFENNMPTRLTLGIYWNIRKTGYDYVEYTLGYKYAADAWFVVARAPATLDWMYRSRVMLSGYYARYLYTIPLDIISSPIQLVGILLTPSWN